MCVEFREFVSPFQVAHPAFGKCCSGDFPSSDMLAPGGEQKGIAGLGSKIFYAFIQLNGVKIFSWIRLSIPYYLRRVLFIIGVKKVKGLFHFCHKTSDFYSVVLKVKIYGIRKRDDFFKLLFKAKTPSGN